jgi:hypothetical protein
MGGLGANMTVKKDRRALPPKKEAIFDTEL